MGSMRRSIRHALEELQPRKKHTLETVEFNMSQTITPATKEEIREYVQRLSLNSLHKRAMGEPLVHQAARGGRSDILKALVMGGKCNLNEDNGSFKTALHVAVDTDNTECALLLLEMGADHVHADAEGETVLMCGAKRGNTQIVS